MPYIEADYLIVGAEEARGCRVLRYGSAGYTCA